MKKHLIILLVILTLIGCEEEVEIPSLSQITVSEVSNNSVKISSMVTNDGNSPIDTIGICWAVTEMPTIKNSTFAVGDTTHLEYQITGLIPKTKYYLRAFAINEKGISYSDETSFTTESNETGVFIDPRDGQEYKIVKIGEKWWFADNLNYRTENSWYFNDDSVNYSSLGRFYTHESALNAIPEGWKMPTDNDWVRLEKELGISNQDIFVDHWRGGSRAQYLLEEREFDFDVVWSGIRDTSHSVLYYNDGSAYFWTATENKDIQDVETWYYCRQIYETLESIRRLSKPNSNGLSVRCVKE